MSLGVKLYHDPRANPLSSRTIRVLAMHGINTWDDLVLIATRTPNTVRKINGLGTKCVNEILVALATAKVDHTIPVPKARSRASRPTGTHHGLQAPTTTRRSNV